MKCAARLVALLALALSGLALPGPAAAQQVGSLVSADPVQNAPPGMQAWRIAYWTRNAAGRMERVTGMVVAPREAAPPSPRGIIAWAHGTSGVAEKCAVSTNPAFWDATPGLTEMVRRGYVVVAPDYPGLGSPGPHPYLVGIDTADSVLDAVRAARAIPGAHAGSRFAVWGESQGGHAALWTAVRRARYAPELTLVGTAAAAPPTELVANLEQGSDANVRAMLTAFLTWSWSQRYGAQMSTLFNTFNQGVARRLAQNNCIVLGATPKLGTILGVSSIKGALRNKDIGRIQPWARLARQNSVVARNVPGPVLIAQSTEDPVVAPAVTRNFARALCSAGRPVRWVPLPGGDHAHSARDSLQETLAWIDARFADEPAPSDCRALR